MLTAFTHLYLSLAQVMVLGHRLQPDCCPSIGIRHLGGQLQLARGRGLCRSQRLQRQPVLGAPGPAQGLQPHSVFHPQTQGDTPPPFRSASPSQSPTEKGAHLASGILGGQLAKPRLHTQQRGRQSRRPSGRPPGAAQASGSCRRGDGDARRCPACSGAEAQTAPPHTRPRPECKAHTPHT